MSTIQASVKPEQSPAGRPASSPRAWARVALACLILAASGGIRWWQSLRVETFLRDARTAPFPLKDLPMDVGSWKGEVASLDPEIVKATGATDLITRRYVDQKTGAAIEAIVLYGPAAEISLHRPEVCYPNAGFDLVGGGNTRMVKSGSLETPFRTLVYSKRGGLANLQEVYYSWRFNGRWSPELDIHKQLERTPGMIKVHLARPLTERERRDVGNPFESFLEAMIPEIESRLARASGTTAAACPSEGIAR